MHKFIAGDIVLSEGDLCIIVKIYGHACELTQLNGLIFMVNLEDLTPAYFANTELYKALDGEEE